MNEDLRRRYVRDLVTDLEQVGGARFEQWIRPLWENIAGAPVVPAGLNAEGSPVSGALDAYWPDGSVSEASSDVSYFRPPYRKPRHDFRHALTAVPGTNVVRLFSSRGAPPTALTRTQQIKRRLERKGYTLDLWDGQRIAEYIVDSLLLNDRFVERVGTALPNLRRIAEQNAANARLPDVAPAYGGRNVEEQTIITRFAMEKCLVVAGLGGIGKSELACAVAHRLREDFELIFWLDAEKLQSLNDLRAFDVRLNGYTLNLLNLLSVQKTLIVLDNITIDLSLDQLARFCGEHSRVLITSQVSFGGYSVPLTFVGEERAAEILADGVGSSCPSEVLARVLTTVDGHPLVLRLLNGVASREGWDAVAQQCQFVAGVPDENRRMVASRILEKHLQVLGAELSFFAWASVGTVDRGFFESVFGSLAIEKLDRWALTARSQSDAVRLHDLVFLSVERIRSSLGVNATALTERLAEYIAANVNPKKLPFFRIVNRHRDLIEHLLRDNSHPGAIRYAYLHGRPAIRIDRELIGDPIRDCTGYPGQSQRLWLLSIVEAVEVDFRRMRDLGDDSAKDVLAARLPVYDTLMARLDIDPSLVAIAHYHKGKSLLKLGRVQEAEAIFESLVSNPEVIYATKLQLARLLQNDPERAQQLILEVIEAEEREPGTVSTSILLETLATIRRAHLRPAITVVTERFGPFMAQQIKAAACSGEDQPFRAFAAVGPDWSYTHPDLFQEILDAIDLGEPRSADDDEERISIGRILTAAGKKDRRESRPLDAQRRFEDAVSFFEEVRRPSPFSITQQADALLCRGLPAEAANILDTVPVAKREIYWMLRRSEAHLGLGQLIEALGMIEDALERNSSGERLGLFLAQKAKILHAQGDPSHDAVLTTAIRACTAGGYQSELLEVRDERRTSVL